MDNSQIQEEWNEGFFSKELFPAGHRNTLGSLYLEDYFKISRKRILNSIFNLNDIENIEIAKANNLRRIGRKLGFISGIIDDDQYRRELKIFILIRKSNGSINFFYQVFSEFSLDLKKIDIWSYINFTPDVLDGSDPLDGSQIMNGIKGLVSFQGFVDFIVNDGHIFDPYYESLIPKIAFIGRDVIGREVIEYTTNLGNFNGYLNEIRLGGVNNIAEFQKLNATWKLNPYTGDLFSDIQFFLDNSQVYTSNDISVRNRQPMLDFFSFDCSSMLKTQSYDEIKLVFGAFVVFDKKYDSPRNWQFDKKIVRWYDISLMKIRYSGDI